MGSGVVAEADRCRLGSDWRLLLHHVIILHWCQVAAGAGERCMVHHQLALSLRPNLS